MKGASSRSSWRALSTRARKEAERRWCLLLCCAVGPTLVAGCAPQPVAVELNFPSQETFLYSEFGRIQVFEVGQDLGSCPDLIRESLAGSTVDVPRHDSGELVACDFRDGRTGFRDVAEGPMAYVVVMRDASNAALLSGCTVAEVYNDAPSIEVSLFMTDEYADAVTEINGGNGPLYANIAAKCGGL